MEEKKVDDEKMLWNGHMGYGEDPLRPGYAAEVIHVRAVEYFSIGYGTSLVGIRITRKDQTKQYVDVEKKRYDELGLDELVLRAIKTREELIEELKKEES